MCEFKHNGKTYRLSEKGGVFELCLLVSELTEHQGRVGRYGREKVILRGNESEVRKYLKGIGMDDVEIDKVIEVATE
jgi:hypothetical protein